MNKLIILCALFAVSMAAPEPPVSGFGTEGEGANPDPELLMRAIEILSRSSIPARGGSSARSNSYAAPSNSYAATSNTRSSAGSNFEIDEIQPAPLVADFDFPAGGNGASRSGGSRGYNNAPSARGYN